MLDTILQENKVDRVSYHQRSNFRQNVRQLRED
jgi:hypothetical protein